MIKLPVSVKYDQKFPDWDKRSLPCVVDADGKEVLYPPISSNHPGIYDQVADKTCQQVVKTLNGKGTRNNQTP